MTEPEKLLDRFIAALRRDVCHCGHGRDAHLFVSPTWCVHCQCAGFSKGVRHGQGKET